jgi:hypothetical protein
LQPATILWSDLSFLFLFAEVLLQDYILYAAMLVDDRLHALSIYDFSEKNLMHL